MEESFKKKIQEEADLGLDLCEQGKLEEGVPHLRFAADNNDRNAITNLGHALELLGEFEESFKWSLKAATLGIPTGMYNVSIMYRWGKGTPCNVAEAVKWDLKLIEAGRVDEGYNEIICAYRFAKDEAQRNPKKAFEYALEGAKKIMEKNPKPKKGDDCRTVSHLGTLYYWGKGVKEDEKEALKYYMYAAKCGDGLSRYNAGCIFRSPDNKKLKDLDKAERMFYAAVEVGYSDGYYRLGEMAEEGKTPNIPKAIHFYANAVRMGNGDEHYQDAVDKLRKLSPDKIDNLLSGKYSTLVD